MRYKKDSKNGVLVDKEIEMFVAKREKAVAREIFNEIMPIIKLIDEDEIPSWIFHKLNPLMTKYNYKLK